MGCSLSLISAAVSLISSDRLYCCRTNHDLSSSIYYVIYSHSVRNAVDSHVNVVQRLNESFTQGGTRVVFPADSFLDKSDASSVAEKVARLNSDADQPFARNYMLNKGDLVTRSFPDQKFTFFYFSTHSGFKLLNSQEGIGADLHQKGVFGDFHQEGVSRSLFHLIIPPPKITRENRFS